MKSKTSFFNRTIFIRNILRFWPMWVLYLIILFFMLPVSLYRNTNPDLFRSGNLAEAQLESVVQCVNFNIHGNMLIIFVMAVIFVLLIFGYLYNAKSCNMIHALPVSRKELFATGYLNGMLFFVGPQVLMFLVSLIVCIINRVTSVEYLLHWLIISMVVSFLFLSSAVFFCMLSGNVIAALVYYVVGNFLYIAIRFLICAVISSVGYGMENVLKWRLNEIGDIRDSVLSPLFYLLSHVGIRYEMDSSGNMGYVYVQGMIPVVLYLIPAVLLLIFAVVLYKKRQLECAGDIVAYPWMNPIFRWIIGFFAGVGLGLIFAGVFFGTDRMFAVILMLFSAVMTLLFFFLAEMILKKRFRIFTNKIWIEGVVCAGVVLFLIGALDGDLFRAERRIPETDQVEAALLTAPGYDMVLEDTDKIQQLEEAHQSILDHKKDYEDYYYSVQESYEATGTEQEFATYTIVYYLKNGECIRRMYTVPAGSEYRQDSDSAVSRFSLLQADPEEFLKYMICKNYENVSYTGGYIDFVTYSASDELAYSESIELDEEQAQTLYTAVLRDIQEGNYPYYEISGTQGNQDSSLYYNTLSLTGQVKGEAESIYDDLPSESSGFYRENSGGAEIEEQTDGNQIGYSIVYPNFNIYTTCTNTIQALIDLGIIQDASDLTTWEEYNEWEAEYGIEYTESIG